MICWRQRHMPTSWGPSSHFGELKILGSYWLKEFSELSVTDLNTRIINRKESPIPGLNRKRYTLQLLQEINYPSNSVNDQPSSPWIVTFLQWTFTQNNFLQLFFFSTWNGIPLLYLWVLSMAFAIAIGRGTHLVYSPICQELWRIWNLTLSAMEQASLL